MESHPSMNVTGIPPHIGIMIELDSLTQSLKALPNSLTETLGEYIEQRSVASRPVTKDEVRTVILEALDNFWQRMNTPPDKGSAEEDESHSQENPSDDSSSNFVCPKEQPLYVTNGKMSRLPSNFILPSGNLYAAWMSYLFVDKSEGTPPLRAVFGSEMPRKLGPSFSRYKHLMEAIIEQARKQGIWNEPKNPTDASAILDKVDLTAIITTDAAKKRPRARFDLLSWTTLAQEYYLSHRPEKRQRKDEDSSV